VITAHDLTCERTCQPLGVDAEQPRLGWRLASERTGARPVAHRILVASAPSLLQPGKADLWDPGIIGPESVDVAYEGVGLRSRQRCWWTVQVIDELGGLSPWADPACFEMGLLARTDWAGAQLIAGDLAGDAQGGAPSPLLRRTFDLPAPVLSARLHITSQGDHEAWINGRRTCDHVFPQGWTEHQRRLAYRTYDVTALLREGRNAIGVELADGWFCGFIGEQRAVYGDRPALLCRLEVRTADGAEHVIASDGQWRWRTGDVLSADHYMGEVRDLRLAVDGWSTAEHEDGDWAPVAVKGVLLAELVSATWPPVRPVAAHPATPVGAVDGGWLFDVGAIVTGRVRLQLRGAEGTHVTVRHGEVLDPAGSLHTANLGAATATDVFILRDASPVHLEPSYTFHGFRYVELVAEPALAEAPEVTAVALMSDLEPTGELRCSDPLLQRLHENVRASQRGNFLDVPSDCPQRAERLGWTGDIQVFAATAAFSYDVQAFLAKWLGDLRDCQLTSGPQRGQYPIVAPLCTHWGGGPAWADAGVQVTWTLVERCGDLRAAQANEASLMAWWEFLERQHKGYVPETFDGFGDWLSLDRHDGPQEGPDERYGGTSFDLLRLAFHARAAQLLGRLAAHLGRAEREAHLGRRWRELREELRERHVDAGGLLQFSQTAASLCLVFDLLEPDERASVAAQLTASIEALGHLTTGFVGTPHLLFALSSVGRDDLAHSLLARTEPPSWLFPVVHGATTVWERWDAWHPETGLHASGMNSFNHYAYGAVGDWLYQHVGGIAPDPDRPGYRHSHLRPLPGGSLTWSDASLRTRYGLLRCSWSVEGDELQASVEVPVGCTATVHLPSSHGNEQVEVGAGSHSFTVRTSPPGAGGANAQPSPRRTALASGA
jgi:alpha-L-rhamnosidase